MSEQLTADEAAFVWREWRENFRRASLAGIDEAKRNFTDAYVEFHTIWPALLQGRELFRRFDGMRYDDPLHASRIGERPVAGPQDQVIKAWKDCIVIVTAREFARLDPNGTISWHLGRETWVLVRSAGRWLLTAGHSSPPANELGPYGHNQFAAGELQYSRD